MSYLEPPNRLKPPSLAAVPGTPPRITLWQLWLSVTLPPVTGIVAIAILFIAKSSADAYFSFATTAMIVGLLAGWVLFIICISKRYRGISLVLMIIAYPLLEGTIVGALFFTGCFWVALNSWNGHSDPRESRVSPTDSKVVVISSESIEGSQFSKSEF